MYEKKYDLFISHASEDKDDIVRPQSTPIAPLFQHRRSNKNRPFSNTARHT